MSSLVRKDYPPGKLPNDLTEGLDPNEEVMVTVFQEVRPERVMSFEEIFATRQPPFLTREQIDDHIRGLREDRE